MLHERTPGLLYFAEHNDGFFYIMNSPKPSLNYQLSRTIATLGNARLATVHDGIDFL